MHYSAENKLFIIYFHKFHTFFQEWLEGGDGIRECYRGGLKRTTARTYEWKRLTKFVSKDDSVNSNLKSPK